MELDQHPLVGRERPGPQDQALRERQQPDGAQQGRADEHVARRLVGPELVGQQAGVHRELARLPVQHGITRRDGLGEHADGGAAGVVDLVLQSRAAQRGARMVAEGEEHLVPDVAEPARAVGADDHAVEAVAEVERDRHERRDLGVGRRRLGRGRRGRVVDAEDLVLGEHGAREPLRHRAVGRVVLEPLPVHDVERPVPVDVGPGHQQALLGLDQLDRRAQDQRVHIVLVVVLPAPRGLDPVQLPAELAAPLALRPPRLPEALEELGLVGAARLQPAGERLEPLALRLRVRAPPAVAGALAVPAAAREQRRHGEQGRRHGGDHAPRRAERHRQRGARGSRGDDAGEEVRAALPKRVHAVSADLRADVMPGYPTGAPGTRRGPGSSPAASARPPCGSWAGPRRRPCGARRGRRARPPTRGRRAFAHGPRRARERRLSAPPP